MADAGTIEVQHGGSRFSASFSVKNGKVHILTPLGSKPAKPAGASPEAVARSMLKELLHDRDKR